MWRPWSRRTTRSAEPIPAGPAVGRHRVRDDWLIEHGFLPQEFGLESDFEWVEPMPEWTKPRPKGTSVEDDWSPHGYEYGYGNTMPGPAVLVYRPRRRFPPPIPPEPVDVSTGRHAAP